MAEPLSLQTGQETQKLGAVETVVLLGLHGVSAEERAEQTAAETGGAAEQPGEQTVTVKLLQEVSAKLKVEVTV